LIITPSIAIACTLGSVQFKAYLQDATGQTDVTDQTTFTTKDPTVAVIGVSIGNATGTGAGSVQITASYQGMSAFAELTVMAGTDCCSVQTSAFMILVDVTKSMSAAFGGSYATRLAFAAEAVQTLLEKLPGSAQVGLMTFTAAGQTVLSQIVGNKTLVEDQVSSIVQTQATTGFTAALQAGVTALNSAIADQKILVLISDGEDETADEFTAGADPILVTEAFQADGGIVMCLGVRASSTDNGYPMLSDLSTGGFFLNALPSNADAVLGFFTGLLGYICCGDCTPEGDVVVGVGALNFNEFQQWNVSGGNVDLIGNGFFDYLPGNGLYVDLGGTSTPHNGVLTTKSTFPVVAGHTYTLTLTLAGNQVDPNAGAAVTALVVGSSGSLLDYIVLSNYASGFEPYNWSFTAATTDQVYIVIQETDLGPGGTSNWQPQGLQPTTSSITMMQLTGSPEGVVTASTGQMGWDATHLALWIKNTATGNTGWQPLVVLGTPYS
jgi:hypothetical protein